MRSSEILTIPNILTLVRLVLLWPVLVYLKSGNGYMAVLFLVLAAFLDSADGYIARHFNQISTLGKAMDPVVDKVLTVTVLCYLVFSPLYSMPLWFLLFVLVREFLLITGGLFIIAKQSIVLQAEKPGKYSAFFNGVVVISYVLKFNYAYILLIAGVMLTLYSTYVYGKRFFAVLNDHTGSS
ncbi:CDP-alcohol phosphatidyltransferase family protein [bacterium]|nr:CDP-alcohol phosphatidyltransferase family protein [bacterium]